MFASSAVNAVIFQEYRINRWVEVRLHIPQHQPGHGVPHADRSVPRGDEQNLPGPFLSRLEHEDARIGDFRRRLQLLFLQVVPDDVAPVGSDENVAPRMLDVEDGVGNFDALQDHLLVEVEEIDLGIQRPEYDGALRVADADRSHGFLRRADVDFA